MIGDGPVRSGSSNAEAAGRHWFDSGANRIRGVTGSPGGG